AEREHAQMRSFHGAIAQDAAVPARGDLPIALVRRYRRGGPLPARDGHRARGGDELDVARRAAEASRLDEVRQGSLRARLAQTTVERLAAEHDHPRRLAAARLGAFLRRG